VRQQLAQDRQLRRVGAHVAHRLDEAVAFGEVILGKRVPLDATESAGDDLPRVDATVPLKVGGLDSVLEHVTELERSA
jgi:hypothetical protein